MTPKKAYRILDEYADWINSVSARYQVPSAVIKAILFQEMTMMNALDYLADLVVATGMFPKKDSSTGYAQIFGFVGLNAVNFAVDRGLATYESLGVSCDHRLDPNSSADIKLVWDLLRRDRRANIEIATINLLVAADEMTGSIDFDSFSEDELKLVLTRYNADVKYVTAYGEQAYRQYLSIKSEGHD